MEYKQLAPNCIVQGCESVSALKDMAKSDYLVFTTFFCSLCYERLMDGEELAIDPDRVIIQTRKLAELSEE